MDLTDLSTIKSGVLAFLARENRLDVLVNNAGVSSISKGSNSNLNRIYTDR